MICVFKIDQILILTPFYEYVAVMYYLEDIMCCISKLQIDIYFWSVLIGKTLYTVE